MLWTARCFLSLYINYYLEYGFFSLTGPSNYNGMAVFDCVPAQGIIGPGRKQEIFSKLRNKSFLVQWLLSVYIH